MGNELHKGISGTHCLRATTGAGITASSCISPQSAEAQHSVRFFKVTDFVATLQGQVLMAYVEIELKQGSGTKMSNNVFFLLP